MNNTILTSIQIDLLKKFDELKLNGFATELKEQFTTPNLFAELSLEERLSRCCDNQANFANITKFNSLYRASKVRNKFYIRQFVPNPSRGLDANTLLMLKEGDFIDQGINIIISGATGTGKTALASATAVEAMKRGLSVMFFRMSDLITIIENKDLQGLSRFKERLKRIKLLIIDDYGLTKFSDKVVNALIDIADIRYGNCSTIFTTQLKKKSMISVIDLCPVRDALADRLFRECDLEIILKGSSWRGTTSEFKGNE